MEVRDLGKSIPGRGHSKCKGPEVSRSSEWPVGQRGMDGSVGGVEAGWGFRQGKPFEGFRRRVSDII